LSRFPLVYSRFMKQQYSRFFPSFGGFCGFPRYPGAYAVSDWHRVFLYCAFWTLYTTVVNRLSLFVVLKS
jgi:hypothetical protein